MSHHEVIVIGGGQAGLAIGRLLAGQDRDFAILEAAAEPAAAWRERWDSLRLFTPVRYDGLPGRPFPGEPGHHPSRDEVVDYLTAYASDLPVRLGSRVAALRREGDGYLAVLDGGAQHTADQVVVATGPFQVPRVPAIADGLDVPQLHSADYRRPADLPTGRVLVTGGGNTGFQIAEELAATREVHLAVGSRQMPLPQRVARRDIFDLLTATGAMRVTAGSRVGRRMRERETLIGSSPRTARRLGIHVHGRAVGAAGSRITFADGGSIEVGAVVWATGFGREYSWIDVPVLDAGGEPVHDRGVTASPGLYFLGLPWQHTRGSALLGWVEDDAAHVAARIAA